MLNFLRGFLKMKPPYLVQRGRIRRPLDKFQTERLSRAINFDYMGSSEFEFGAIPASFRAFRDNFDQFKVSTVPQITEDDVPLRVAHCLSDEDFQTYVDYLLRLRNERLGKLHTKEAVRFDPTSTYYKDTDIWWDIEHQVIWSFDKTFMKRIGKHFEASFEVMGQ